MMCCAGCGLPVEEHEEKLLGDLVFHPGCDEAYLEGLTETLSAPREPLGLGDFE